MVHKRDLLTLAESPVVLKRDLLTLAKSSVVLKRDLLTLAKSPVVLKRSLLTLAVQEEESKAVVLRAALDEMSDYVERVAGARGGGQGAGAGDRKLDFQREPFESAMVTRDLTPRDQRAIVMGLGGEMGPGLHAGTA